MSQHPVAFRCTHSITVAGAAAGWRVHGTASPLSRLTWGAIAPPGTCKDAHYATKAPGRLAASGGCCSSAGRLTPQAGEHLWLPRAQSQQQAVALARLVRLVQCLGMLLIEFLHQAPHAAQ